MQSTLPTSRSFRLLLLFLLGACCLAAVPGARAQDADIEALRERIARNGWSFEVSDRFTGTLTPERRTHLRGFTPPPGYQQELERNLKIFPVDKAALPSSLDWRSVGGITPVKDQASCGSCWAFAATAELEAFVKIYYGVETNLSEQQVVSCNVYGAGCDGGWATAAYNVFQNVGAVLEDCHPYLQADPPLAPCLQDDFHKYGFITGYSYISNDVEQIKAALQYGPVCTGIDASTEFEAYAGGCYDVPGYGTNHLVLIVGYDDRLCDGAGAWIIKNSWGTGFGVSGYINVQYGAGNTGISVTQLDYTAPPVRVVVDPALGSEDLYGDMVVPLAWTTSGAAAPTVDIWMGIDGLCNDVLVAENVPNTGSYSWTVPNLGTNYGSLVIFPSGGTSEGFGFAPDYLKIIGHKVRYVSPLGSNTAPYETPATAAHTINAAVAACTGTDSVMVAAGDYVGTVTVSTTVRLFGGWDSTFSERDPQANPTRLQSGGSAMRFYEGSGEYGLVDGFVIHDSYGGTYSSPVSGQHGAAIYTVNASPTIRNCVFEDNRAASGSALGYGGAICAVGGAPLVQDCSFNGNIASSGGAVGLFSGASMTVEDCWFTGNSCADSMSGFVGAGILVNGAQLQMTGGELRNNGGSESGGALYLLNGSATLAGTGLIGNRALNGGGAVQAAASQLTLNGLTVGGNATVGGSGGGVSATGSELTLRNVRFTGNTSAVMGGGVMAMSAGGVVENCQFDANAAGTGGGLVMMSAAPCLVRNNVATGNSGGGLMAVGADLVADCNNAWGNTGADFVSMTPGAGSFSLDPCFVDAAGGDFGLAQASPCIDRGADDGACLDPDGSRADIGLLGGPGAAFRAPAAVSGAALTDLGGGLVRLTWTPGAEPDLAHYVVYCDTAAVFMPSAANTVAQIAHPAAAFEDTPPGSCYYLVAAVDAAGLSGGYSQPVVTGGYIVGVEDSNLPRALAIGAVVPNPFNPRTTIRYEVPVTGRLELLIFDVRGRKVRQLVDGVVTAGRHEAVWDGCDDRGRSAATGVYFARLRDGRGATTAKMVLAK